MERIESGIKGLDDLLNGGIPYGHTVAVIGPFGSGKTTMAMQFIYHGLINNEKCVYISLEEDRDSIIKTAKEFSWNFDDYIDKNLLLVKLDPEDAKSTMTRVENDLTQEISDFGAKRVVLDSATLLTMMFQEEHEKRKILFLMSNAVKKAGATSIFTGESKPENPMVSRDGLLEYVADGVILLNQIPLKEKYELRLVLQILKMRRTSHSRKMHPFYIGEKGIEVLADVDLL